MGEVLGAVGGVEAFGKDDQVGACARGFKDTGAGAGEVACFVGTWRRERGGGLVGTRMEE